MTEGEKRHWKYPAVVTYDGKFCSEECIWLYGGADDPWCHLFGAWLNADEEGSPIRHHECVRHTESPEESA